MPAVKSLVFALVATAWATHAVAQDQPPLQEVLVTAQKRLEDIQKVPISIAVLDNASFDELHIQNLADVATHTPGVDYQVTGPKNLLAIRGIYSGGGAATSAIYIDDVPVQLRVGIVGLVGATLPAVFDLDRVEVLRGPQGTLFGSSAEGGAIRFITPEPSLTSYSGYSRADVGYTDKGSWSYELGAAYGGPIVHDELGFRVSAWHRRDGGYVDHISAIPGGYVYPDSNWSDSDVVRAVLAFAPTESFRATPSVFYQHLYYHDSSGFEPADSPAYNDAFTQQWASLNPHYSNVSAGDFVNAQLQQTPATDTLWLTALKLQFDLTGMELISNTGYLYRTNTTNEDFTTATPVAFGLPWPTVPEAADHNIITTTQNVLTEDLRLQSAESGRALDWTVGLWFYEARQRNYNPEISPYLPTLIPGTVLLQPGNLSYIGDERSTDKQYALYGQATYRFTRHWSVTAGARVAHNSVDYSIYQAGPFYGNGPPYISGTQSETVVNPKVGINFQLDDNNLFYVSAAKGDRVGGVNAPFPLTPNCQALLAEIGLSAFPPTFKGDSLWSYEIGSKNRLLDGHLVTQGSAFYIDWSNVQQAVSLPPNLCPESFTSNLGKARSYGFDLNLDAQVGAVELGLAVGYTNARNTESLGTTVQYVTDGQQINPYSVPWTVVAAVQYSFAISGNKGYVRVDNEFHSKNNGPYPQSIQNNVAYDPNFIPNPSTNVLNAHLGVEWGHGLDTSVYVLNATNTHPRLYSQELEVGQFLGPTWTLRPLTFGTRVVYRW
jgi:outer membrane receptor protein involved in Fe transport